MVNFQGHFWMHRGGVHIETAAEIRQSNIPIPLKYLVNVKKNKQGPVEAKLQLSKNIFPFFKFFSEFFFMMDSILLLVNQPEKMRSSGLIAQELQPFQDFFLSPNHYIKIQHSFPEATVISLLCRGTADSQFEFHPLEPPNHSLSTLLVTSVLLLA